jgi:5-methylcytosine-specific restriction protein A
MQIGRKKSRLPNREDEAKTFNYQSRQWKKLRKFVLARDKHLCQICLDGSKVTPGNVVDHKIPIKQGGAPLAAANLQTLCEVCHAKKSQTERLDR